MKAKTKRDLHTLLQCICDHYGVEIQDVYNGNRQMQNVKIRKIFYYLAFEIFKKEVTLVSISECFFNQHYTTIIFAKKTIANYLAYYTILNYDIKQINENYKHIQECN